MKTYAKSTEFPINKFYVGSSQSINRVFEFNGEIHGRVWEAYEKKLQHLNTEDLQRRWWKQSSKLIRKEITTRRNVVIQAIKKHFQSKQAEGKSGRE
jgi:hypothetical protein